MSIGPVDFLALEFPGNKFKGDILPELRKLVEAEIIGIIDLVLIVKDPAGQVIVRELQELDPEQVQVFDPLQAEVDSLITHDDIKMISDQLAVNSSALLMLIENIWAAKTKQAMLEANGRLVMFERIPHEVVEEALAEIASMESSAD